MLNDFCKFPHKLTTHPPPKKIPTLTPKQIWMPNHLKNVFREDMDLMTVWDSSLAAKILLTQLQHKIDVQILAQNQKFQD